MKTLVVDLDGTLTFEMPNTPYENVRPRQVEIARLREYADQGFRIAIHTARNMRTFGNSVGRINAVTAPIIVEWLKRHEVPFDELYVGKPWCGDGGFYIDDKAIRPSEFVEHNLETIRRLLTTESKR